ncbi:MAG: NUDIX domain-containing protein [archaeon]
MAPLERRKVVSSFIRHDGRLLLLKRSENVGTYQGKWGIAAGHVEPEDTSMEARARIEIEEELGIPRDTPVLVKSGESLVLDDHDIGISWEIHPFLFDVPSDEITLDWEHTDYRWIDPSELSSHDIVPMLDRSLETVWPQ